MPRMPRSLPPWTETGTCAAAAHIRASSPRSRARADGSRPPGRIAASTRPLPQAHRRGQVRRVKARRLMREPDGIEAERYELFEASRYQFEVDRRDFVKTFATGLVVLLVARQGDAQESGQRGGGRGSNRMPSDVS